MVQTTQGRTTRPSSKGSSLYQRKICSDENSGTVARINTESVQGQVYTKGPKPKGDRKTLWRGSTKDSLKSRVSQKPPPLSETGGEGLRLHLGCGGQNWEGFVNIDDYPAYDVKPDLKASITSLPYEENTVDEIWLIHVFEHIYIWDAEDAVAHWFKILKPGGKLVIEVPCMDKIISNYNKGADDPRLTFLGIFGEQIAGLPEMVHKWCYSKIQLSMIFKRIGFEYEIKEPIYHMKDRDMRCIGVKP